VQSSFIASRVIAQDTKGKWGAVGDTNRVSFRLVWYLYLHAVGTVIHCIQVQESGNNHGLESTSSEASGALLDVIRDAWVVAIRLIINQSISVDNHCALILAAIVGLPVKSLAGDRFSSAK